MKNEFMSSRMTRTLLKYAQQHGIEPSSLVEGLDYPLEVLMAGNDWIDERVFYELLERAEVLLHDKDLGHKVGLFSAHPKALGVLSSIVRLFSNAEALYEKGARYVPYFNRCLRARAKKVGEGEFEYEIFHLEGGKHKHYFQACRHTVGVLEAIPVVFGLPQAIVTKDSCWTKIGETGRVGDFYYGVDENGVVTAYFDKEKTRPLEVKGKLEPDGTFVVDGVKFGAPSCKYHIVFQNKKRKRKFFSSLFTRTDSSKLTEQIAEFEKANSELIEKHEALRKEALKAKKFGEIASALVSIGTLEDVLGLVSESILKISEAEIVNILLVGENNTLIAAPQEWGLRYRNRASVDGVRQLVSEFGIDSPSFDFSCLPVIAFLFREKKPILTQGLTEIVSPIFPPELCRLLDNLTFTKHVALIPLSKEEENLGALLVLSEKEIEMDAVVPIANLGAQAIWNVKKTEEIIRHERELENKVLERTYELENANRALKEAQALIVNQEKLASLGEMAAGIAHELNTPVGYFHSNLNTLKEYTDEILSSYKGVLSLLDRAEESSDEFIRDLALKKKEEMREGDIEYILKDIEEMIEELQISATKIKDMVQNLREFARPGEGRIAEFDINAGIKSAILLLWGPLRHRVVFYQELKPVPLLYGYPSEINQAIMNILRNAVDACGEKGNIWVRSYEEDGAVRVEIEDDGSGIPPELIGKIFDPFFTTKEVGSGFGLGLAIANSIMHKHGGLIEVESTPGKGSKFTLVLPLEHDMSKEEAIPISTANMITKGM